MPFSPNRTMPGVEGSPFKTQSPRNSFGNSSISHLAPQVPPVSSSETQVRGKAAGELFAQTVQVDVGPHGRRRAAFHVDDAAAVHPAALDGAAPGIA